MLLHLLSTDWFLKTSRELHTVVSQHQAFLCASDQDNGATVSFLLEWAEAFASEADSTTACAVTGLQLELFFLCLLKHQQTRRHS